MSEVEDIIARVFAPGAFHAVRGHGEGECPQCDGNRLTARTTAAEAIAALDAAGYVIAPKVATDAMKREGVAKALSVSLGGGYRWPDYMADLWATMIAEAAKP